MTYPIARLVDAPSSSATVRYDFNDRSAAAPRRVQADSFTLGSPSLNSPTGAVSPVYGDRTLSFIHEVSGSGSDADAAVTAISRELLRSENWFMFQRSSASRPTFWRLYPTGPNAISFDRQYVNTTTGGAASLPSVWELPITLTAENLGYGALVTVGPYTITQASSGTNPLQVALPSIAGDGPTRLRVTVVPGNPGNAVSEAKWLVGCVAGTSALTSPVSTTITNVLGSGSTGPHSDSTYYNNAYFTASIGAGSPNLDPRFLVFLPSVPVGRYKLLLRATFTTTTDQTILFQGEQFTNASSAVTVPLPITTVKTNGVETGRALWVDLGEMSTPVGVAPPSDGGASPQPPVIQLSIGTTDGATASVNVDAVKMIPIQGETVDSASLMTATFGYAGLSYPSAGVFDGDLEQFWWYSSSRYTEMPPTLLGGFPVADPLAETNLLVVMAIDPGIGALSGNNITKKGATESVTASYHPRVLHFDGRP